MKMAAHDNVLETNTQAQSQDFGIGDASVVIEILRNRLYEHKIRTLTQEYMSNGRDASREVKADRRIVVSIPNALSPVFKVRDFGPGISPDRMRNVFVMYGASTKRGTNGQTGGFGIGAKSAWSYTDSFTIVTYVDGTVRTYVAHTGVNNQGRLDLISTDKTDEPNGTEIQVAVKPNDLGEFKRSIQRACYFWNDKEFPEFKGITKLEEVPRHKEHLRLGQLELTAKPLPDFLGLDYYDKNILVIDGIVYPIGRKLLDLNGLQNILSIVKGSVIIHVGNGVVEVSASRESIADSEFTRDNLRKLCVELNKTLVAHIKAEFKAVKSNADWIKTYHELSNLVRVDDHSQYGDYNIERGSINSKLFSEISLTSIGKRYSRRGKVRDGITRDSGRFIPLDKVEDVFYRDTDDSIVVQNGRVRDYLEKTNKTGLILVDWKVIQPTKDAQGNEIAGTGLTEKQSKKTLAKIMSDFGVKPLSSLPYTPPVRVPREKKERTKEMFTIHAHYGGGKHLDTTTLETVVNQKRKYLYVNLKDYPGFQHEFSDVESFVELQGYRLAALSDSSIEIVENSANFTPYQQWKKDFTPDVKLLKAAKSTKAKNLKEIKLLERANDKIKCKHVSKMILEYKGMDKQLSVPQTILKMISKELVSFVEDDEKLTKLLDDSYPLVRTMADIVDWKLKPTDANELAFYINAKQ